MLTGVDIATAPSLIVDGSRRRSHDARGVLGADGGDAAMVVDVGPVYEGSDGRYYASQTVDRNLHVGEWRPCLRDADTGNRLVGTDDGELLMLRPTCPSSLPAWAELRSDGDGVRIADTRRARPRGGSRAPI